MNISVYFGRFSLDSNSGVLSSASSLAEKTYNLIVQASDRGKLTVWYVLNFVHKGGMIIGESLLTLLHSIQSFVEKESYFSKRRISKVERGHLILISLPNFKLLIMEISATRKCKIFLGGGGGGGGVNEPIHCTFFVN